MQIPQASYSIFKKGGWPSQKKWRDNLLGTGVAEENTNPTNPGSPNLRMVSCRPQAPSDQVIGSLGQEQSFHTKNQISDKQCIYIYSMFPPAADFFKATFIPLIVTVAKTKVYSPEN